jgi:hypothetical protein
VFQILRPTQLWILKKLVNFLKKHYQVRKIYLISFNIDTESFQKTNLTKTGLDRAVMASNAFFLKAQFTYTLNKHLKDSEKLVNQVKKIRFKQVNK